METVGQWTLGARTSLEAGPRREWMYNWFTRYWEAAKALGLGIYLIKSISELLFCCEELYHQSPPQPGQQFSKESQEPGVSAHRTEHSLLQIYLIQTKYTYEIFSRMIFILLYVRIQKAQLELGQLLSYLWPS